MVYLFFFLAQYLPSSRETGLGIVDRDGIVDSIKTVKSSQNSYAKYSADVRYEIGTYASEVGDAAAVRKFERSFPKLNESTVRGFRKKYQHVLIVEEIFYKSVTIVSRGRFDSLF